MKPWQAAKKWHIDNGSDLQFEQLLGAYLNDGFVWSSPTEFMCFAKVRVENGRMTRGKPNAWYVGFCAGKKLSLGKLMSLPPHPMEWVCWHRGDKGNRFVCVQWDKLKGRKNGVLESKSSGTAAKGLRKGNARHLAGAN